jgi:hypothetical protein
MTTSVTNELIEYMVPTCTPFTCRPAFSLVNQIWKNDHRMAHEAKKSNRGAEV